MIWLYMAVWMTGQSPRDYKVVAKTGPFETMRQCWTAGALSASAIQSKDNVSNALGACQTADPSFLDMKSMWGMVCAFLDRNDMCWSKNGEFVDPLS